MIKIFKLINQYIEFPYICMYVSLYIIIDLVYLSFSFFTYLCEKKREVEGEKFFLNLNVYLELLI